MLKWGFMYRLLLAVFLLAATRAPAQDVTLKLATLAPVGSSWHVLLKELGERFAQASDGTLKVKIYAGGTQGTEGDMVRKMGIGQLQAASLSNIGLHDLATEPMVFSVPGMADEATATSMLGRVRVRMESALEAKGYVVLQWAEIGTVYIFCTEPYRTPEEAGRGKFFVWEGDPGSVKAFEAIGMRPVVLASTDIAPALATGMITCLTQVPAYVLATRVFEKTNAMVDYPWSYLIGATVVRKDAWEKLDPGLRVKLLDIAREVGAKVDVEVKRLNADAIEAMKKQGLSVVKVEAAPWQKAAERAWPVVRGAVVPSDFFDEVVKVRRAVRQP
jgi:TRAP-type C4-dicarboxylate transport system substrate-binding protein